MDASQKNNEPQSSNSSSRLSSSKSFPVHLHHRNRSDVRPPNDTATPATTERQHWSRRLFIDTSDLESDKSRGGDNTTSNGKQRHSKPRDHHRIPRAVNQIASAGGARNLLPTRSFHKAGDRDREAADGNLLKPSLTHDSSRSLQSSRSTSAHNADADSRKGSLSLASDLNRKLGWTTLRDIKTMDDLEEVRRTREKGEEFLRAKLSSMGLLAADITRQLDYTYYNLLERVSTLYSTIRTFQELIDSSSALQDNFQRDNANIESDIRKQLGDFQNFDPQMRRIDVLEDRMSAGRNKMEALGDRLDVVRREIKAWERRENEWQARVSRRLRIFWGVMGTTIVVLVIAYVVQKWPAEITQSASEDQPRNATHISHSPDHFHMPIFPGPESSSSTTPLPAGESSESITSKYQSTSNDPLRLFDEL